MKIKDLLCEIDDEEFHLQMMTRHLQKEGFFPSLTHDALYLGCSKGAMVQICYRDEDYWDFSVYFKNQGDYALSKPSLAFEEVLPAIRKTLEHYGLVLDESIKLVTEATEEEFQLQMMVLALTKNGFEPKINFERIELLSHNSHEVCHVRPEDRPDTWEVKFGIVGEYTICRVRTLLFEEVIPTIRRLANKMRIVLEDKYDPAFKMLDGTNPAKPYTQSEISAAMKQLHARIERQAAAYGNKIDKKGTFKQTHKFLSAQIAPDE